MKLQYHPDGIVYIRDGLATKYGNTTDNFALDYGAPITPPHAPYVGYQYDTDTKILVYEDAFGNAFPIEGQADRPDLDTACQSVSAIQTAQATRETAAAALLKTTTTTTGTATGTISTMPVTGT